MEEAKNAVAVSCLRTADARLQEILLRMQTGSLACVRAEELASWRAELRKAAAWMTAEAMPNSDLDLVRTQFRNHLEKFVGQLPLLRARLLTERARLEAVQLRMSNATAWAKAHRETL